MLTLLLGPLDAACSLAFDSIIDLLANSWLVLRKLGLASWNKKAIYHQFSSFSCRTCTDTLVMLDSAWLISKPQSQNSLQGGKHYTGDCTPTHDRGQSEVKRSRWNFEAGQAVKLGIRGSLSTVKVSPGNRWAWLMFDSQGSRPDFRRGPGVKYKNLLGQDRDPPWVYYRTAAMT